jgi:hypothetical protein
MIKTKKPILGMLYASDQEAYLMLSEQELLTLIQKSKATLDEDKLFEEDFNTELLKRTFAFQPGVLSFEVRYAIMRKQMFNELNESKKLNSC